MIDDLDDIIESLGCFGNWSDCMRTMEKAKPALERLRAENERLTKERDEVHYTAHIAETCCARAEERAEAAERKMERLREALEPFGKLPVSRFMTDGIRYNFRIDAAWVRRAVVALKETGMNGTPATNHHGEITDERDNLREALLESRKALKGMLGCGINDQPWLYANAVLTRIDQLLGEKSDD